jgi:hypothetical protein
MGAHDETSGFAEMSEYIRTWRLFTALIKWDVLGAAAPMLLLPAFRTNT